jgi:MFS family permease
MILSKHFSDPRQIVSQWYPPQKTQSRMAMFYLSSALSGAFSGLLAAGIAQMRGVGGYEGWRWIFLLEGILSVVVGISCFFLLPDSPGTASWLKPDEARFLELMHVSSRGAKFTHEGEKDKKYHWKTLWQVLCDKQLYLQALVFASNSVPNYGLKFTMPQVSLPPSYYNTHNMAPPLTNPPRTRSSKTWATPPPAPNSSPPHPTPAAPSQPS